MPLSRPHEVSQPDERQRLIDAGANIAGKYNAWWSVTRARWGSLASYYDACFDSRFLLVQVGECRGWRGIWSCLGPSGTSGTGLKASLPSQRYQCGTYIGVRLMACF